MKTINKLLVSSAVAGLLGTFPVSAAERVFLSGNTDFHNSATNTLMAVSPATLVGLSSNESLQVKRTYRDANGTTTIRYRQHYKGIPVLGDDIIISRHKNGNFKSAHGAVVNGLAADLPTIQPKISANNAMSIAKAKTLIPMSNVSYENESKRLAIWLDPATNQAHLVFEVTYMQNGTQPSRPYMIIDAATGEVLHEYDNLQTANGTGPGGNQKNRSI